MRTVLTILTVALLTASAQAQGAPKKPRADKAVQSEVQKKKQRAADKAHKSTLDKMPDQKFDPWSKIR